MSKLQDIYDFTVKQFGTPEQALKAILYHNLDGYDALKAENHELEPDMEGHPLVVITMAAFDLGWDMAIESDHPVVRGVTVGTAEYIDRLFGSPEGVEFSPEFLLDEGDDDEEEFENPEKFD